MSENAAIVYIVDDNYAVRTALRRLLASHGYRVEIFASASAFLEGERADAPGCLVLDIRMPGVDGLDLQEQLLAAGSHIPVVFITGYGDIPTSVQAMKAGAVDFLRKPVDDTTLLAAVDRAIAQHVRIRRRQREIAELQKLYDTLTPRQQEVFAYVVTGMLNKQIAYELGVTEKTIRVHRSRVMRKMQANSIVDLVRFADHLQLTTPPDPG